MSPTLDYDTVVYKACLLSDPTACDSALMIIFVNRTVGQEILSSGSDILLYPNPNQGEFYIRKSASEPDMQLITLHDMSGRIFPLQIIESGDRFTISTQVKPGIYHLNMVLENGKRMGYPLLVQ